MHIRITTLAFARFTDGCFYLASWLGQTLSKGAQVRLETISIKADDAVYWKRTRFGGEIAKKYLPVGVVKAAAEVCSLALAVRHL